MLRGFLYTGFPVEAAKRYGGSFALFLFRRSVAPRRAQSSLSAALRSETPTLRFGPSGDCDQRSAKKSAQEEESRRKSPANPEVFGIEIEEWRND